MLDDEDLTEKPEVRVPSFSVSKYHACIYCCSVVYGTRYFEWLISNHKVDMCKDVSVVGF